MKQILTLVGIAMISAVLIFPASIVNAQGSPATTPAPAAPAPPEGKIESTKTEKKEGKAEAKAEKKTTKKAKRTKKAVEKKEEKK